MLPCIFETIVENGRHVISKLASFNIPFQIYVHYKQCNKYKSIFVGNIPLTDSMLWSLAKEITNSSDIRTLGLKLKVDNSQITTFLTNHPNDINGAAFDVLRQWRDNQDNATVAYGKICEALKDAKQIFLISKVLQ